MTNKERQQKLDKQKYLKSERIGVDMSGAMTYCCFCKEKKYPLNCDVAQEVRESKCLCAKAYNRMKRSKKNDKARSD